MLSRGAIYPKRAGHGWQYATTESKECRDVGVTAALEPVPPDGTGWEHSGASIVGTGGEATVFHWWKRRAE